MIAQTSTPHDLPPPDPVLMAVRNMTKYFPLTGTRLGRPAAYVKAVDGVSFDLYRGTTLGLVGESGCGKTTLGRAVLRLIEPTSGSVMFNGQDIMQMNARDLRGLRRHMQMVFQDPFGSLNPRMSVEQILEEPLVIHRWGDRAARQRRVQELLEIVGLAAFHRHRYPHEFSGGQRQRIGIARALATHPQLIVADEPVSALDVSIQSQILNLLADLQQEFGLTYLFIAHGLNVVRHISDRVGVMYLGTLVELAESAALYAHPRHPYTQALFSAIPIPDPDPALRRERIVLQGDVPSPVHPPAGCRFHTRCPWAEDRCRHERPVLKESVPGHWVACHFR